MLVNSEVLRSNIFGINLKKQCVTTTVAFSKPTRFLNKLPAILLQTQALTEELETVAGFGADFFFFFETFVVSIVMKSSKDLSAAAETCISVVNQSAVIFNFEINTKHAQEAVV